VKFEEPKNEEDESISMEFGDSDCLQTPNREKSFEPIENNTSNKKRVKVK
jgi:hypothetical protein